MKKILIVEDSKTVVHLISSVLEGHGFTIQVDFNGDQAVNLAKDFKPDMILLDVNLPAMDGYQISMLLLEDEETRKIPVVVMTTKGGMKDTFALSSNVVDFIQKPFQFDDLHRMVQKILKI